MFEWYSVKLGFNIWSTFFLVVVILKIMTQQVHTWQGPWNAILRSNWPSPVDKSEKRSDLSLTFILFVRTLRKYQKLPVAFCCAFDLRKELDGSFSNWLENHFTLLNKKSSNLQTGSFRSCTFNKAKYRAVRNPTTSDRSNQAWIYTLWRGTQNMFCEVGLTLCFTQHFTILDRL